MKKIAIFATGAGSNARRIIEAFRDSDEARVSMVACNKQGAGVTHIAASEGIPLLMLEKTRFFDGDGHLADLQAAGIDWIVLAGFLWKVPDGLVEAYRNRIVNIHPALLPKFGGKGMYGPHVHEAVIRAGEKESGITIHMVDERYDHGKTVFQASIPVEDGETPESLAAKIHRLEHLHYPDVIRKLLSGKLPS